MIDFHSHVLPHIDDGAKDVETAVQMLEESKRQGVRTVICTPHYYGKKRSPERFIEKRRAAYAALSARVPEGIELRFAAEVYFTADSVVSFEELSMLCIENTRYIMIELPFTPKYEERLFEKLEAFISETDCVPLIAHVDRYPAILKKPSILRRLAGMGCLFQVNAEAFFTQEVKGFAMALLKKGMVHAVGSDMHNMGDRAPNMQAFCSVLEGLPAQFQENLIDAEAAILENRAVIFEPKSVRKWFGKYF